MMVYHLPGGREIFLVRWAIEGTYAGLLEGTLETASRYIRKSLPERAAQVLSPATPLTVVPAPDGTLPQWLCVAEFGSRRGVNTDDPDFNSMLYACWFMDDTALSLDAVIESILPQLDWDQVAEDYDFM